MSSGTILRSCEICFTEMSCAGMAKIISASDSHPVYFCVWGFLFGFVGRGVSSSRCHPRRPPWMDSCTKITKTPVDAVVVDSPLYCSKRSSLPARVEAYPEPAATIVCGVWTRNTISKHKASNFD